MRNSIQKENYRHRAVVIDGMKNDEKAKRKHYDQTRSITQGKIHELSLENKVIQKKDNSTQRGRTNQWRKRN